MTEFRALTLGALKARPLVTAPRKGHKLFAGSGANEDAERRNHETLPGLMGGIARGLIAHRYLLVSVRLNNVSHVRPPFVYDPRVRLDCGGIKAGLRNIVAF
jgi:hypothetical protein